MRNHAFGILLVGSVANSERVRHDSDLDLIIVSEPSSYSEFGIDRDAIGLMRDGKADIAAKKEKIRKIDVSLHIMSPEVFDGICNGTMPQSRVLREKPERKTYVIRYLSEGEKNVCFHDCNNTKVSGSKYVVDTPEHITSESGHYALGIHADKILSGSKCLYEAYDDKVISRGIERLWDFIRKKLNDVSAERIIVEEAATGVYCQANLFYCLHRHNKVEPAVKREILLKSGRA